MLLGRLRHWASRLGLWVSRWSLEPLFRVTSQDLAEVVSNSHRQPREDRFYFILFLGEETEAEGGG